ncbi:hypothetical protein CDAR_426681 [Caerostris darwini]|uniref:ATP synthase F0 subunit 8 n=1 Tax=Caerostris darwini TaxID=1538125 RepID=A0AAV4R7R6_9ARAC|nr:hypothetical protein CDAR_426681 [Caerostris darwini]
MEEYTFVSQYPETTKSAFTFLHPFNLPIWTCILVSLVIVSVCFAMLKEWYTFSSRSTISTLPKHSWATFRCRQEFVEVQYFDHLLGVLCKIYPLLLYFDSVVVSYTASERISDTKFS